MSLEFHITIDFKYHAYFCSLTFGYEGSIQSAFVFSTNSSTLDSTNGDSIALFKHTGDGKF